MSKEAQFLGRIKTIAYDGVLTTADQILCTGNNKKLDELCSKMIIAATADEISNYVNNQSSYSQTFLCVNADPGSEYITGSIYWYNGETKTISFVSSQGKITDRDINAPELYTNLQYLGSHIIYNDTINIQYTYTTYVEYGGTLYVILDGKIEKTIPISDKSNIVSGEILLDNLEFGEHDLRIYAIDIKNHRSNVAKTNININK